MKLKQLTLYDGEPTHTYWSGNNLCAICIRGTAIYLVLGKIKKKNDGRYEWFYIEQTTNTYNYFLNIPDVPEKIQGTCSTKEDAEIKLETLWGLH